MNIFQRLYTAIFKSGYKKIYIHALQRVVVPDLNPPLEKDVIHFKHFGLIGDIIYAIPAMLELAQGRQIHLHLQINQKSLYKKGMKHQNRDKILTEKSVEMLAPLILTQPGFTVCDILSDQRVDYDLDYFRKYPFDYNKGHICRWYFQTYGINADLGNPWLTVIPNNTFKDEIVIARSFRYRAPGISYAFLNQYPNLSFIGLKEEYEDLRNQIPALKYKAVNNFLEFAEIIAGCRFFIGNQSFPFSVAEALKVRRVLEIYFECPNVIPEGKNGYDFCYQPQFEKIVKQLYQH
jgi:hypothetical protein